MQGFDAAGFFRMAGGFGHMGLIGLRHAADGADWVELAIDHDPRLAGDSTTGAIASGAIVTMMDMATSMAVWARRGAYRPQVTLDLRLDYLRPAVPGRTVHGRGECYRLTRAVAFVRGHAHDGDPDDPVAHVAGTFMLLERS